jgi:hypothetical protein
VTVSHWAKPSMGLGSGEVMRPRAGACVCERSREGERWIESEACGDVRKEDLRVAPLGGGRLALPCDVMCCVVACKGASNVRKRKKVGCTSNNLCVREALEPLSSS